MNKGDKIALVAQPIAAAIDRALGTNTRKCGGCKRMQTNLNAGMSLGNAVYERFWKNKEGQTIRMSFQRNLK